MVSLALTKCKDTKVQILTLPQLVSLWESGLSGAEGRGFGDNSSERGCRSCTHISKMLLQLSGPSLFGVSCKLHLSTIRHWTPKS